MRPGFVRSDNSGVVHAGRGEDVRGAGCVSESDLRAFLLGDLPERVGRTIAAHLETCEDCEAVARGLDGATDPIIDRLRLGFGSEAGGGPPARDDVQLS